MEYSNEFLHTMRLRDMCSYLRTSPASGLSSSIAKERLAANGKNQFSIPKEIPRLYIYLRNCFWGFGLVILLSAILSIFYYLVESYYMEKPDNEYLITGIILFITFFFSGSLRYLHSNKDNDVGYAFKVLMPMYCTVIRDSNQLIIRSENVVLGDVLVFSQGERIAADVRFFTADELVINNVALSGFSLPIDINPKLLHKDKWIARNVGFACSHVVKGTGMGIVIACGDSTEVGIMARLSMEPRPDSRVRKHIIQVTFFTISVSILLAMFLVGIVKIAGFSWRLILLFIIGIMVAGVPMCLPSLVYFSLLHTKKRLIAKNCFVRNLEAACTLGLTSVICSDMTGTMTMSRSRVSEIYFNSVLWPVNEIQRDQLDNHFMELIRASVLCNDGFIYNGTAGMPIMKKGMNGNDYDRALLKYALNYIHDINLLRREHPIVGKKPYDSIDHLHITIHRTIDENEEPKYILFIKGYYDAVLERCTTYLIDDEEVLINETLRDELNALGSQLTSNGRRTYAFGYKDLTNVDYRHQRKHYFDTIVNFIYSNPFDLRFLGLIACHDPPRANIVNAISQCRSSGIKLVLITRSKVHIAKAVAKELGIISKESETVEDVAIRLNIPENEVKNRLITAAVINMVEMRDFSMHHQSFKIEQILLSHSDLVFAGTNLEQKHMIVAVCQNLGAVVTVLGSSVHDTPAIRRANVGVTKGVSSSHTTKLIADVILLDDNLATLINAIEESRLLFENKKKAITYVLSSIVPQIAASVTFIVLKIPMLLSTYVAFIIYFLVDLFPALTLFYEKAEEDLMQQEPKVFDDFLISRRVIFIAYFQVGIILTCASFISYFVVMARSGFFPTTLVGLSPTWCNQTINDITDSYGQEWTSAERLRLDYISSSAYLLPIIILQAFNLLLVRTGRSNLFYHGFSNNYLNMAVVYLLCIGFILCEVNLPHYFRVAPIENFEWFWFVIPFVILLIFVELLRRYFLRRFPGGWLELETFY